MTATDTKPDTAPTARKKNERILNVVLALIFTAAAAVAVGLFIASMMAPQPYPLAPHLVSPGNNPAPKCEPGEVGYKGSLNGSSNAVLRAESSDAHISWELTATLKYNAKTMLTEQVTVKAASTDPKDTPIITRAYLWQSGGPTTPNPESSAPYVVMSYKTPPSGVALAATPAGLQMRINDAFFVCVRQQTT